MLCIPESRLDRIIFGCNSRISLSELYTSGSCYFCPVLFENLFMLCQNTLKTWLRGNVQGFSQIFNWMQVWALTRPLSDIYVLEPLQCHSGNMLVIIIVDCNFFFLERMPSVLFPSVMPGSQSLLMKISPQHDATTTMHHCGDGVLKGGEQCWVSTKCRPFCQGHEVESITFFHLIASQTNTLLPQSLTFVEQSPLGIGLYWI